ncbi:flippase [Candidatus Woesearchaeota archaeon]|nr:flippase [Candidatus Woesearchaeota archaeon]
MSNVRRIASNFKWLVVTQVITVVAGFLLGIIIPRHLGAADFGKFSFAISFSLIFATFADVGLNKLIIREIARAREMTRRLFVNVVLLKAVLSIVIYIVMIVTINLLGYTVDAKNAVYVIGLQSLLATLAFAMKGVFQAYEKMNYEAIATLLEKGLTLVFVLAAVMLSKGIVAIGLGYLAGTVIAASFSMRVVRRLSSGQQWVLEPAFAKHLLVMALPFFFVYVSSAVNLRVDTVMISLMLGNAPTGLYTAAQQLVLQLFLLSSLFTASVFPAMSRLAKTHGDYLRLMYSLGMKYLLIASLPIAVGTMLLQDRIVHLFYGSQFAGSAPVLGLTVWLIVPYYLSAMLTNLLMATDKQHISSYSIGAGAIVNIILNLVLIPIYGIIGAGIATVITQSLIFIVQYGATIHSGFEWNIFQWKPILAAGVMGVFVNFAHDANIAVVIGGSALLYVALLLLLRTFSPEERALVAQAFARKESAVVEA